MRKFGIDDKTLYAVTADLLSNAALVFSKGDGNDVWLDNTTENLYLIQAMMRWHVEKGHESGKEVRFKGDKLVVRQDFLMRFLSLVFLDRAENVGMRGVK